MKKNTTVPPILHLIYSWSLFIPLQQIPSKYSPIDLGAMDFHKGLIGFLSGRSEICFRGRLLKNGD